MRLTPSSTARRRTRTASSGSGESPHTPGPGSCIAPKPSLRTVRSPPIVNVPEAAARGVVDVISNLLGELNVEFALRRAQPVYDLERQRPHHQRRQSTKRLVRNAWPYS